MNLFMQRHSTVHKATRPNHNYSPHPNSVLECPPTCASADRPPRYARAIYRDLVLEFHNANYFHRKDYAASRAG